MSKLVKRCRARFDRLAVINAMPASERPAAAKRQIVQHDTDGRTKWERVYTPVLGSMWNPNNKRFAA